MYPSENVKVCRALNDCFMTWAFLSRRLPRILSTLGQILKISNCLMYHLCAMIWADSHLEVLAHEEELQRGEALPTKLLTALMHALCLLVL